jgi:hypothetical protein
MSVDRVLASTTMSGGCDCLFFLETDNDQTLLSAQAMAGKLECHHLRVFGILGVLHTGTVFR